MVSTYLDYLRWGANGWGDEFFFGFIMTLKVSFFAYVLSALFGLLGAMGALSRNRISRSTAAVYTTLVRSLPELLMVLIIYFTVAGLAERALVSIGFVDKGFQFNPFWAAVFSLAFVSGAFMAEVFRAALLAVPSEQLEAAAAIGLSSFQIFKRVTLPHMMALAIPGLGNMWLSITKESAIISVLGAFGELLYTGYRAAASTKAYAFFYGLTAVLFLIITMGSLVIIFYLERYLNRGRA